jgi:1,2-diacylglycerol 3-beta-glucosyltransferase
MMAVSPIVIAPALTVLLGGVAGLLCLPALSDGLCLLARRRRATPGRQDASVEPVARLLFLVPAHNEELLIAACVRSILEMNYPPVARRVVVVADNCTDATAALAREAGAETLERHDLQQRGKPRALAWALRELPLVEWDACVIIDADSTVDRGFAYGLGGEAPLRDRLVQAYFGTLNESESWLTRLAGVLTRCRYEVTYPLKQAAGLNSPLTGNGMCIGTARLRADGWQAFSLTENWELYAQYTAAGCQIRYAGGARLFSQEAHTLRSGATQRRRWLAGRLSVLRHWGGRLLRSRHIGWHQKLDALCELGAPSPVLHLVFAGAVAAAAVTLLPRPMGAAIAVVALLSLSSLVATTLLVLRRHPERWSVAAAFLMLPVYAAWRAALAGFTLVTLREQRWRKTEHHASSTGIARATRS